MEKAIPDLRRSNSSPPSPSFNNDIILVKVVFPSLECTKILRLNSHAVSYEPLVKILSISKIDDEAKKDFRLFTPNGLLINPGDSLLAIYLKEKDTLIFKQHKSMAITNLSASGELKPVTGSITTSGSIGTVDYWGAVSSFLGSFLKRRPTINELPRHVFEMLDAPIVPQSHVIVACISYLREKEAHVLEGIFRLSGLATEVRAVCESFKKENFDLDWVKNPHTIATALKQYCRYVTPSIIPSSVCTTWGNLIRASAEESEVLDNIVQGISLLPPENRFMLTCLFSFMKLVLENQDTNKMASHNLSVVWGPNLVHFQIPNVDAFSEANLQATLMNMIITHIDKLKLWDE